MKKLSVRQKIKSKWNILRHSQSQVLFWQANLCSPKQATNFPSPSSAVGAAPWQTLQSSFLDENLMDRRNLHVPFMPTFVSKGNNNFFFNCYNCLFFREKRSDPAFLLDALDCGISFHHFHLGLCVYLHMWLCSLTQTETRDRKPFSPPATGETCYASSIQSNPLVTKVHLQPN